MAQLAREVAGLPTNGAAQREAEIRKRLASAGVPPEAHDVEIEKIVRRIDDLADTSASSPPYQVLGPAPAGSRCDACGKGGGARIKYRGMVCVLHPHCADSHVAAMDDPPVKIALPDDDEVM